MNIVLGTFVHASFLLVQMSPRWQKSSGKRWLQIKDDLKNKDDSKNEDDNKYDPKNKDKHKNEDAPKNEDNTKNEEYLKYDRLHPPLKINTRKKKYFYRA